MAEHPDVELLRRGHEAFNERDFDTLASCFTEDVRWHTPGRSPMAGTIEGRDALVRDFFEAQRDAPIRLETHDVLANGEHLVGIGMVHVGIGAEMRSFRFAEVCHTRDGRISERWGLTEDQPALDELIGRMAGS